MRCLLLHGLRSLLGARCVDAPRIHHLYSDYPEADAALLYGRGFTYARQLDAELPVDRADVAAKIAARHFDAVVFGSVHRGTPYRELVLRHYAQHEVAVVCGEDAGHECEWGEEGDAARVTVFVRELDV
jgi:hypothetical protein